MEDVQEDLDIQIKREQAVLKIGKIPFLTGEKMQIKRLFQNLINNAIKFHKPNEVPIVEVFGKTVKWHGSQKTTRRCIARYPLCNDYRKR